MLIIRRSNCINTASCIVLSVSDRPVCSLYTGRSLTSKGWKPYVWPENVTKAIINGDIYIISYSKTDKRRDVALGNTTRDVMLHCRLEQEADVPLQATTRDVVLHWTVQPETRCCTAGYNQSLMLHCRLEQETDVALLHCRLEQEIDVALQATTRVWCCTAG